MRYRLYGVVVTLLILGCARKPDVAQTEIEPGLHQYILTEIPADLPNRTFVDFGGKVHLIGYEIEPADVVPPGTNINLTLYWQSVAPLSGGWRLFTHIVDALRMANFDDVGPLREAKPGPNGQPRSALGPSRWQPGKVYVDKQTFQMPTCLRQAVEDRVECADITAPRVTLAVGLWREAALLRSEPATGQENQAEQQSLHLRMPVLSGATDGENRAIVTNLRTGISARKVATKTSP